jgi:hypothetical protein
MAEEANQAPRRWGGLGLRRNVSDEESGVEKQQTGAKTRWNMGMLNDRETIEVPGMRQDSNFITRTRLMHCARFCTSPCKRSQ